MPGVVFAAGGLEAPLTGARVVRAFDLRDSGGVVCADDGLRRNADISKEAKYRSLAQAGLAYLGLNSSSVEAAVDHRRVTRAIFDAASLSPRGACVESVAIGAGDGDQGTVDVEVDDEASAARLRLGSPVGIGQFAFQDAKVTGTRLTVPFTSNDANPVLFIDERLYRCP